MEFENFTVFELTERLKEVGIGEVPLYVDILEFDQEMTKEFLTNITQAMILLNLHPFFPYPFYVITDKVTSHDLMPICRDVSELPTHFSNRVKRLKQKEQLLLNKVQIKSSKLANISLHDKIGELKNQFKSQRKIMENCQEENFYRHLIERLGIHLID